MPEASALRSLGLALVGLALVLAVCGLLLLWLDKLPGGWRLPGDLLIQRGRWTVFVPITTMVVISLILTLILNLLDRR